MDARPDQGRGLRSSGDASRFLRALGEGDIGAAIDASEALRKNDE